MTVARSEFVEHAQSRPRLGLCLDCGYALHGLATPRCPECGREFDPLDPTTMNMGRPLTAAAKWVLGPMRWPVSLLTWAAVAFALWMARLPGAQIRTSSSIVILITLGVLWLAWPIVRIVAARRYGWPQSLLMQGQKQRLAVGLIIAAACVAIFLDWPMHGALKVSRGEMDRLAQSMMQSGEPYADDQWVGVYRATRIKAIPGGIRFTCEEQNRAYKSGFMYLPKAQPKSMSRSRRSVVYLGDGWFAWRDEG